MGGGVAIGASAGCSSSVLDIFCAEAAAVLFHAESKAAGTYGQGGACHDLQVDGRRCFSKRRSSRHSLPDPDTWRLTELELAFAYDRNRRCRRLQELVPAEVQAMPVLGHACDSGILSIRADRDDVQGRGVDTGGGKQSHVVEALRISCSCDGTV